MYKKVLALVLFVALTSMAIAFSERKSELETERMVLELKPVKIEYLLGEVVVLKFELTNFSGKEAPLPDNFGIGGGNLSVQISKDGKDFQDYGHPGWGLIDMINVQKILKPAETIETSATILWKWKGSEKAEYLFPEAGDYFITAKYLYDHEIKENQSIPIYAEAKPIKLHIIAPQDQDLAAWKEIKKDADFAYFLQHNDLRIPPYQVKERELFEQKIEKTVADHPGSFYSATLSHSLNTYRQNQTQKKSKVR